MNSTIGGDDPLHDYTTAEKDKEEKDLRKEADDLRKQKKQKECRKKKDRANEISRRKSKRAHKN